MELNGVPLHPLVVHAVVIFGPLAALTGLVYRELLRTVSLAYVVVAAGAVWG